MSRFEFYRDAQRKWRWRFRHKNGNVLADSGQGYYTYADCWNGAMALACTDHKTWAENEERQIQDQLHMLAPAAGS